MRGYLISAAALAATMLAGCATTGPAAYGPTDVTRFHLAQDGQSLERGTVVIETLSTRPIDSQSLEFRSYAAAVERELAAVGYAPVAQGATSDYIARVNYVRAEVGRDGRRSPVSVGVGGSTGSYGSGVGVGVGINLGSLSGRSGPNIATELSVSIEREADASVIWEGRADTITQLGRDPEDIDYIANKLATALFRGFPGESGRTISVP